MDFVLQKTLHITIKFNDMLVFLFFTVKPLTVNIINPPSPLVADRRYEVHCESSGSRPNAIITWYKGKRQLKRAKVSTKYLEKDYLIEIKTAIWWFLVLQHGTLQPFIALYEIAKLHTRRVKLQFMPFYIF